MLDLWYKNAILYCLDVETFMDGNGDGIGDFEGLTKRLGYLDGLGITCLWLLPFYPSPNRDNGYDVMDYYNVDPRLGTLGDFVNFTYQAKERGIRILSDLVVNHTSDQHPWFKAACQDKNSQYRSFYIWSEEKPEDAEEDIMFPGKQETTWTYHEEAQAYYFHRFYHHQPELNIANPKVREEIEKIMGFWLQLGVSGFRLDSAPHLVELKEIKEQGNDHDPLVYLKEVRNFLSWRRGDAILLAEANVPVEQTPEYFGDGDKMQMLFDFYVNKYLFLALAEEDARPLIEALKEQPTIPKICQWAHFVRNHDELTLDHLTDEEQDQIAAAFAPDREKMWIFGRGIRRRFPPMVDGDVCCLELAYSLMLSLPGTPVIRYGEEIGMGDDLSLPERHSVRTPMQWSNKPNAGFSTAPSEELIRPVISEGKYSYKHINVNAQRCDPSSFLNWMERAIHVRKECPEFGWGQCEILETGNKRVFAHRCEWHNGIVIAVHNLGKEPCTIHLNLKEEEEIVELLGNQLDKAVEREGREVALSGYGYRWFRVGTQFISSIIC